MRVQKMSDSFGKNLKELRKRVGLTQQAFAERLNLHEQTVSRWERGASEPDMALYGEIATVLDVDIMQLWGLPCGEQRVTGHFDMASFGASIARERKNHNESQSQLASELNVSPDAISKWERGIVCPDLQNMLAIAIHYDISPAELYFAIKRKVALNTVSGDLLPTPKATRSLRKPWRIFLSTAVAIVGVISLGLGVWLPLRGQDQPQVQGHIEHIHVSSAEVTENVIEPTCIEQGSCDVVIYCEDCHEELLRIPRIITATGHNFVNYVSDGNATCLQNGTQTAKCEHCDVISNIEEFNSKLPHVPAPSVQERYLPPTCVAEGRYDQVTYCQECLTELTRVSQTIEQTGHYFAEYVSDNNATCSEYGTKTAVCQHCPETQTVTDYFSRLPHTPASSVQEDYVASSCVIKGHYDQVTYCKECHYKLNSTRIDLDLLSHDLDQKGVCKVCNSNMSFSASYVLMSDGTYSIWKYTGDEANVVLPSYYLGIPITHVGGHMFEDSYIESVIIPEGYRYIEGYAFRNCRYLKSVTLPSTMVQINQQVFQGCISLASIVIPDPVTKLGDLAFDNCTKLTDVTLGKGLSEVPEQCFRCCSSLQNITFRGTLTKIGVGAFVGATSLKTFIIPSTVKTIESSAFGGCTALQSIVIPDSVTMVRSSAFFGCSSLSCATVGKGVKRLEQDTFIDCNLQSLVLSANIIGIESNAFDEDSTDLTIYYGGTQTAWQALGVNCSATVLFYADTQPDVNGYWHFVNNVATPWVPKFSTP